MKKIIIACMALLLAGCSHMQTYTSDQMMDRSDEQINDQGPMQETRSHTLAVNEMGGSSSFVSQVCEKNGQPMIDLYFDIPENGHIDTVLSYEIVPESDVETLDGLFMVSVDDQVVPSSVEGGKMAEVHYVQLPVKGSLSEIDVDVSQIDLRYNHSIDFSFIYKSNAEDQMHNGEPVINRIIYGSLRGFKADSETGKGVSGALFGLFKPDETVFSEETAILTSVSDENGVFEFKNIPCGEWIIKELKAPHGYELNDEEYKIKISENGQTVNITVTNKKIPEIPKTGEDRKPVFLIALALSAISILILRKRRFEK